MGGATLGLTKVGNTVMYFTQTKIYTFAIPLSNSERSANVLYFLVTERDGISCLLVYF